MNKDKFAEYYCSNERISELSEYVHQNFKMISTKMISEMRRKLDIDSEFNNSQGYISLFVSLHGRMFNEMVYATAGVCQSTGVSFTAMLPPKTLMIILDLMMGINPLNGSLRKDVIGDKDEFIKMYQENIKELRSIIEALPR